MSTISTAGHYRIASSSARTALLFRKFIEQRMLMAGIKDIVPAHGDVLAILFQRGRASMSELAQQSGRTKATTTVLIDKLVKTGYAKRCVNTTDARSTLIELSDKGRSLEPLFEEISCAMDDMIEQTLGKEKADALQDALARLINAFSL